MLLQHPFTMIVAGPTGSGKTWWVTQLISNYQSLTTFKPDRPTNVLWCYGQWQSNYNNTIPNTNINYYKGMISSNINSLIHGPKPDVIVVDDLMEEAVNDPKLSTLFTQVSHHENVSVIFIIQNLFVQGKKIRNITTNTQYYVLLKTKRDLRQVVQFGNQLMYGDSKSFKWAYLKATNNVPFSYLFCDMHPKQRHDEIRLRTWVLPHEHIKGSPLMFIPHSWMQ